MKAFAVIWLWIVGMIGLMFTLGLINQARRGNPHARELIAAFCTAIVAPAALLFTIYAAYVVGWL